VFRCIKTLQEYGLIAERGEGYVLTPMMLKLMPSLRRDPLAMVAEPYLRELQAETDETVNLVARWDQNETITLATYPSRHSIRLVSQVGQVSFLHAGAVPKAMLAFASPEEQKQVLAELAAYPRYTEWTVLNHEKLREELREIRERGYSISDQDYELGGRGVGAPIYDRRGNPIGGISVGGPTVRVSEELLKLWGPHVVHVADRISAELGWTGSPSPTHTSPSNREDDAS
jgi:DNA-binding IclR family transcriptional regulator